MTGLECSFPHEHSRPNSIPIPRVHRNQFQTLQQRTRIRNEFHMPALRAAENRISRSLTIRRQTDAHQLVALQLLLAAQTANGLLIRIVGSTTGNVYGWFHASSLQTNREGRSELRAGINSAISSA